MMTFAQLSAAVARLERDAAPNPDELDIVDRACGLHDREGEQLADQVARVRYKISERTPRRPAFRLVSPDTGAAISESHDGRHHTDRARG